MWNMYFVLRYKQQNTKRYGTKQSKRIIYQKAINCLRSVQGSNVSLILCIRNMPVSVCNTMCCVVLFCVCCVYAMLNTFWNEYAVFNEEWQLSERASETECEMEQHQSKCGMAFWAGIAHIHVLLLC